MLPRVVMHNAVSVDGRIDGFTLDLGLFYGLVSPWKEDATLAGSETILTAQEATDNIDETVEPFAPIPGDTRPLLVVPDSWGRVRFWNYLRRQPYWRDVVVLCCRSTPGSYLAYLKRIGVDYLMVGDDRVDFRAAPAELNARYGVQTVRVDSGGTLNGVLLRAGLVDEVSVVVAPCMVGGTTPRSVFRAPDLTSPAGAIPLRLLDVHRLEGDIVWLRYEILGQQARPA